MNQSEHKGFTLNMAHFVERGSVEGGFIVTGKNTKLNIYVRSDYNLGYVFGAFLSIGNSNISTYKKSTRGMVVWRFHDEVESDARDKLAKAIEESFYLSSSRRKNQLICYSKPLAEFFSEFGKSEDRHLPEKYLVNNKEFLDGLKDGIEDFCGHKPDERDVINKRKYSEKVRDLYELLSTKRASKR